MEYSQQFIDNLIALKDYYQQLIGEHERKANQAKEQLNHVNALLFDQLERQYKEQHSQISNTQAKNETGDIAFRSLPQKTLPQESPELDLNSTTEEPPGSIQRQFLDTQARSETSEIGSDPHRQNTSSESPQLDFDSPVLDSTQLLTQSELKEPTPSLTTDLAQDEQPSVDLTTIHSNDPLDVEPAISNQLKLAVEPAASKSNESSGVKSAAMAQTDNSQSDQQPTASSIVTVPDKERRRYTAPLKTPLLPPYQHLSKSEAVEKLLQDNEGKTFHIDEITRGLHGDLGVEAIKPERARMYDTLRKGVAKGLWSAVPNSNKYYTIDLKSL